MAKTTRLEAASLARRLEWRFADFDVEIAQAASHLASAKGSPPSAAHVSISDSP